MQNVYCQLLISSAQSHLTGVFEDDRNVRLKLGHSLRVARLARRLMTESGDYPLFLREAGTAAATLHDLGRFEQLKRFHTFFDARSIDHGDLSAAETARSGILCGFPERMQQLILRAIALHNKRTLPSDCSADLLAVARLVRDADKLDIFSILLDYFGHPQNDDIVYQLEKSPRLSESVAAALAAHRSPANADFETVTDFMAAKIAWVYDLGWPYSFQIFTRRRYLERLAEFLPPTPFLRKMLDEASSFVKQSFKTGGVFS